MTNLVTAVLRGDEGQDLIEYALLAALISLASVVAIAAIGSALGVRFTAMGADVSAAGS